MPEKKEESVMRDILRTTKDDLLIPRTKEVINTTAVDFVYMIADAIVGVFGKLIFGKDSAPPTRGGRTGYSNISRRPGVQQKPAQPVGNRSSTELQYVVVDTKDKADKIQAELIQSITQYGKVRVADLYELSGKVKSIFTDFNYGWTNPGDVHYIRNRDGYWFNMPNPTKIN